MIRFDVVDEPCVTVRYIDSGVMTDVSIRELFQDAHKISGIYSSSVFEEYGVKRILEAFFMDMYRPKDSEELKDIVAAGCFDMVLFDQYVAKCRELGDVFNLFDEELPFLQLKHAKTKGLKVREFASLYWDLINENKEGAGQKVESKNIFTGLCAYSVFLADRNGRGYPSNINKIAPCYMWINGDTLFKELILNAVTMEDWADSVGNPEYEVQFPYADEVDGYTGVYWRQDTNLKKVAELNSAYNEYKAGKNKDFSEDAKRGLCYNGRQLAYSTENDAVLGYRSLSLLEAMTYQGKVFLVKPVEYNGKVVDYMLYYVPGGKFYDQDNTWRDPYCIYKEVKVSKKGDEAKEAQVVAEDVRMEVLKAEKDDYLWVSCLELLYQNSIVVGNRVQRPLILKKFGDYTLDDFSLELELQEGWGISGKLKMTVYAAKSDGGKYLWMNSDSIYMDPIVFDKNLVAVYCLAVESVGYIAGEYVKKLRSSVLDANLFDVTSYYAEAKRELYYNFITTVSVEDQDAGLKDFRLRLLHIIDKCLKDSYQGYATTKKVKTSSGGVISCYAVLYQLSKTMMFKLMKHYKIEIKKKGGEKA